MIISQHLEQILYLELFAASIEKYSNFQNLYNCPVDYKQRSKNLQKAVQGTSNNHNIIMYKSSKSPHTPIMSKTKQIFFI